MTAQKLHRLGSGESSVETDNSGGNNNKKLPSSQYKGVVPQPNGRWGAQIYQKHQRVWLGTFNLEPDAARAYDVAAQRFRGRDAITNFKPLSDSSDSDASELEFLGLHSKCEIVDMLRKHTYSDELLRKKKNKAFRRKNSVDRRPNGFTSSAQREHLFEKTVTPSDVGKLNRLVIPKQHAEKHFRYDHDGGSNGILMNFEDANGKVWRFRYSYWNSSQSYVLTKGWSRFVKEKSLQAGDVVCFEKYFNGEEEEDGNEKRLFIHCRKRINKQLHVVRLFGVNISSDDVDNSRIDSNGKRSGIVM